MLLYLEINEYNKQVVMSKDEAKQNEAGQEIQAGAVGQGAQGAKPAGYYNPKIDEDGKIYGLKAANLNNTDGLAKGFMAGRDGKILQSLGISIEVPAFQAISGVDVFAYLKASGVDITGLYKDFTRAYTSQTDYIEYQAKVGLGQSAKMPPLGEGAKAVLEHIQGKIFRCFNDVDLEKEGPLREFLQKAGLLEFLEQSGLSKDDLLMIRSTGVNEDQAHQALAGSNFSGPSKAELADVVKRIGDVVASYFSEKSLSQRIAVNDATVLEVPSVLPVLAQKMVGEKASSDAKDGKDLVYSIVIYTDGNGAMRAQIAATHGEGIVNSKLPVDNIAVDKNGNMTILSASGKVQRIAAEYNEKTGKMELVWKDNPRALHNEPALAPEIAPEVMYALHKFASSLEKTYGQRMDMELVFDPASKKVSLVQARAIPDGARAGLEASAVAPEMIAEQPIEFVKAKDVATPDVNKAVLVVDPRQLLFEDTINIALEKNPDHEKILSNYQTVTQQPDQSAINNRAVIVTQEAPNTSHEAGQFNAYAVPVMQMSKENQDRLKKLLEEKKYFVIDPQHGGVYVVPDALAVSVKKELQSGKTIAELTEFVTESGFIAKGVYASAAMPQITTIEYDFKSIEQEQNSSKAKLYQGNFKEILGQQTLGDLIILARKNDDSPEAREAAAKLMSIAYGAMEYGAGSPQEADMPHHNILQNLDALSRLKLGAGDNHECQKALGGVMRSLYQAKEKGLVSKALFNQMMLQGASLALMIDDANAAQNVGEAKTKQIHMAYLKALKQFSGAITAGPENGRLVDSFVLELKETKHKMEVQKSVLKILHPETYSDDMLQALKPLDLEKIFKNAAHFRPASFYKLHDKGTLPPAEQKQAETQITQERLDLFYQASKLTDYFINDQQKNQWLKFCLECTKTTDSARQLNELIYQVLTNNLATQWANIMFTQTYNEQYGGTSAKTQEAAGERTGGAAGEETKIAPQDSEQGMKTTAAAAKEELLAKAKIEHDAALRTLEELTGSFAQLSSKAAGRNMSPLEKITAAKKIIASMKAQIPMWAEPGNFEKLYNGQNGFSEQLKEAMKLLEFNPKASPLEQMMIIEARDKLIDTVDLTAKSLQTSGKYEDKDQQAKNFAQLITEDFYKLMKQCVRDGGYPDGEELFMVLDEFIQKDNHDSRTATADQLNLAANFDVSSVTVGTAGLFGGGITAVVGDDAFSRGFTKKNPTIASLHTLLHQNAIASNFKLASASNELLSRQLPKLVEDLDQALKNAKNSESGSSLSNKSTTYNLHDGQLEIEYNIPLRNHSCKAYVSYNFTRGKTYLRYSIFGEARNRWEKAEKYNKDSLKILEIFDDLKITQPVYFSQEKGVVGFEVEITQNHQIQHLVEIIENNIAFSFGQRVIKSNVSSFVMNKIDGYAIKDVLELISQDQKGEDDIIRLVLDSFEVDHQRRFIKKLFSFKDSNDLKSLKLKNAFVKSISRFEQFLEILGDNEQTVFIQELFTLATHSNFKGHLKNILNDYDKLIGKLGENAQGSFLIGLLQLDEKEYAPYLKILNDPSKLLVNIKPQAGGLFVDSIFDNTSGKFSNQNFLQKLEFVKKYLPYLTNSHNYIVAKFAALEDLQQQILFTDHENLLSSLDNNAQTVFVTRIMFSDANESNMKDYLNDIFNSAQGDISLHEKIASIQQGIIQTLFKKSNYSEYLTKIIANLDTLLPKLAPDTQTLFLENLFKKHEDIIKTLLDPNNQTLKRLDSKAQQEFFKNGQLLEPKYLEKYCNYISNNIEYLPQLPLDHQRSIIEIMFNNQNLQLNTQILVDQQEQIYNSLTDQKMQQFFVDQLTKFEQQQRLMGEYHQSLAAADKLEEQNAPYNQGSNNSAQGRVTGNVTKKEQEKFQEANSTLQETTSESRERQAIPNKVKAQAAALGEALTGKMTEQKAASKEQSGASDKVAGAEAEAWASAPRSSKEHEGQVKEVAKQLASHLKPSDPEDQGLKQANDTAGQQQPLSTPASPKASKESPKSRG